jgi:hypothetical protein
MIDHPVKLNIGKIEAEVSDGIVSLKVPGVKIGMGLTVDEIRAAWAVLELECRANLDFEERERLRELFEDLLEAL